MKKQTISLVSILFILLSLISFNFEVKPVSATITGAQPPASGDWIISQDTTVEDESNLIVNGSIVVNNQKKFEVQNSTITINGNFSCQTWKEINLTFVDTTFYLNVSGGTSFICGGGVYWFNAENLNIYNMTNDYNTVTLRGYQSIDVDGVLVRGASTFTLRGDAGGTVNDIFSNSSSTKGLALGGEGLIVDNATIINYLDVGITFDNDNIQASNLNVTANPDYNNVDTGIQIWGRDNLVIEDIYVRGYGALNPHHAIIFGGTDPNNNTVRDGTVIGCGNGASQQWTETQPVVNYLENLTLQDNSDGIDGNLPMTDSRLIISDCTIDDSNYTSLSIEHGVRFDVIDTTLSNANARDLLLDNGTAYLTNVVFENSPSKIMTIAGSGSGFVYQKWNFTGSDMEIRVNMTSTQNGNVTIQATPTLSSETLSFTIDSPSSTTSSTQIYCGSLGQPNSIKINNVVYRVNDHWTYNSGTQIATITWVHASEAEMLVSWIQVSTDVSTSAQVMSSLLVIIVVMMGFGLVMTALGGEVAFSLKDLLSYLIAIVFLLIFASIFTGWGY